MADVQREGYDAAVVRSKIYGVPSSPHHGKRITSESYASHHGAGGGAGGGPKKRHGSHSASFLPQVPSGPNGTSHTGGHHPPHQSSAAQHAAQVHAHAGHYSMQHPYGTPHGHAHHRGMSRDGHDAPHKVSADGNRSGTGGGEGGGGDGGDGTDLADGATARAAEGLLPPGDDAGGGLDHLRRSASAHSALGGGHPHSITAAAAAVAAAAIATNASGNGAIAHLSKALIAAQQQSGAAAAQAERLRTLLREKEIEMLRLKHENVLLKQIERRHQRDLEQFEAQALDAPRVIRGLREEVSHLKHKIKVYFGQIGEDSRQIRQIDDERRRLREHNLRLEKLVAAKNLADRDTLNAQLEDANKRLLELEKAKSDALKKSEVTEKNLMNDNKQLRGKIHSLERENVIIHDRVQKLDDTIHEKDKTIASLSIYRYNAVHRKNEAVCKVCLKREKEESENRRRQQIRDSLPEPPVPSVTVTSATSIQVSLAMPLLTESHQISRFVVYYSDDPSMAGNVQTKKIQVDAAELVKASAAAAAAATGNATSAAKPAPKDLTKTFALTGLTSGKRYYLQVTSCHADVESDPSRPEVVLVDTAPLAPTNLKTNVTLSPTAVRLVFKPPASNGGSPIARYRVYTSPTASFAEKFLVAEIGVDELIQEQGDAVAVSYYDPQIAVPMFFKIAAVNVLGEGALSETSPETIVDFAPNQPSKPVVKRISSSSVQVLSRVEPNRGSPVQSFLVLMFKSGDVGPEQQQAGGSAHGSTQMLGLMDRKEIVVPTLHGHPYDLTYTVEGLDRGTTYRFQVQASNAGGDSTFSDLSEEANIDVLVPAPGDLFVEILSASSVRAIMPSISSIEQPKIIGFKVAWSAEPDIVLSDTAPLVPADATDYVVEGLTEGCSYYFAVCLVGEHEEGVFSAPVFVPLAAAFALPPSPIPTPLPDGSMPSEGDLYGSNPGLTKSLSKGSSLSLNQRVANMHHGMPAYHDPPVDDGAISPRSSMMSPRRSFDSGAQMGDDGAYRDVGGRRAAGGAGGGGRGGRGGGNGGTASLVSSKAKVGRSTGNLHGNSTASNLGQDRPRGGLARSTTNLSSQQPLPGTKRAANPSGIAVGSSK
nr:Lebercilin [Polyrhizophydium stewartii]